MDHLKRSNNRRKFLKDTLKLTAGTITLSSLPTIQNQLCCKQDITEATPLKIKL